MDTVTEKVRSFISVWTQNGEAECRSYLASAHASPTDPGSVDVLTAAYHTLLLSILTTWPTEHRLDTTAAFVEFTKSVLQQLPTSSSVAAHTSPNALLFGEIFLDVVSTTDNQLEDLLLDLKPPPTAETDGNEAQEQDSDSSRAKASIETDRDTLGSCVHQFLAVGFLRPQTCGERLSFLLLKKAGLVADQEIFKRKETRVRTNMFYKQTKFNLLREQSEGYSKLLSELTSGLGPLHDVASATPTEPYSVISARAKKTWERVMSLIGSFNLDPNRALDIIIDVFSVHVATNWSFFLALLSCSPWVANYRPPKDDAQFVPSQIPHQYDGKSLDDILSAVEATSESQKDASLLPPASTMLTSSTMAQILGFKFSHYQNPETVLETPRHLYLTAALLIKEGFVTLEDLLPHLSTEAELEQVHKDYVTKIQSKSSSAKMNLLAMAAPLPTDDSSRSYQTSSISRPVASTATTKEAAVKTKSNQVIGLTDSLLAVGSLKTGLSILTRYPWIVDVHPQIADIILRNLDYSLKPLFDAEINTTKLPSFSTTKPRYTGQFNTTVPVRKPQFSLWAPVQPSTINTAYVFFYPQWRNTVPRCTTLEDAQNVLVPLLKFIGWHASREPAFLTKLARIAKVQMQDLILKDPNATLVDGNQTDPDSHPLRRFWLDILRSILIPSIAMTSGNATVSVDIWFLLRTYDYPVRWGVYAEWQTTMYSRHIELTSRKREIEKEASDILKRLSKDNLMSMVGPIARLLHSNPMLFNTSAIRKVMSYSNIGTWVVQAIQGATTMGFDTVGFVLVDAFAGEGKERVKDDGVNIQDWLQNLSSFSGALYKRYASDLQPVLHYIVHQLSSNQLTDAIILRDLIQKLSCIEPLPSLSNDQVALMAGGPMLRIEALSSAERGMKRNPLESMIKTTTRRLADAIIKSDLGVPLLILLAQQRQKCAFGSQSIFVKALSSLYDTIHGILLQYQEMLVSTPSIKYTEGFLPPIRDLGQKYGLTLPIVMQLWRPVIQAQLLALAVENDKKDALLRQEREQKLKARLLSKVNSASSPNPGAVEDPGSPAGDVEMVAAVEEAAIVVAVSESEPSQESPWIPLLSAQFADIKAISPPAAVATIGIAYFTTFWQLSSYDLAPPLSHYETTISALRQKATEASSAYKQYQDRDSRIKRDAWLDDTDHMIAEFKAQGIARDFTRKRLQREKQHWFPDNNTVSATSRALSLVENCFLPRCLLSPMDADYSAQMFKFMHTSGVKNFWTLKGIDRIFSDAVTTILYTCSEHEVKNYGRFLNRLLVETLRWFLDEKSFEDDNFTTDSSGNKVQLQGLAIRFPKNGDVGEFLDWNVYRGVFRKWCRKLSKMLVASIKTGDFVRIYNAVIVLKEIVEVLPLKSVNNEGVNIANTINELINNEKRQNLKTLASSYNALLSSREADWKPETPKPSPPPEVPAAPAVEVTAPTDSADVVMAEKPAGDVSPVPAVSPEPSVGRALPEHIRRPVKQERINRSGTPTIAMPTEADNEEGSNSRNGSLPPPYQNGTQETMPPPEVPSQTVSAQDLRDTAKASIGTRPSTSGRRSASPPSRPGTRSHSNDSRASGGRKSDRGTGEDRREERPGRTRESKRDRSRERGDKWERDRGKDRTREERRSERDSDREKRHERDRGPRDRHHSDDRERGRDSRKDEDSGKRRREADSSEADRSSKRGTGRSDRAQESRSSRRSDVDVRRPEPDAKASERPTGPRASTANGLPPTTPRGPRAREDSSRDHRGGTDRAKRESLPAAESVKSSQSAPEGDTSANGENEGSRKHPRDDRGDANQESGSKRPKINRNRYGDPSSLVSQHLDSNGRGRVSSRGNGRK